MKVSIIVPVYNAEKVLHFCVDSILNQTFKDFELILIDDGSTDRSGDICDEYAKDNDNIVTKHIENSGVSVARNIGIETARGVYICFIDSDDYLENDYLETLVKIKNDYQSVESIWCGFKTVDGYNNPAVLQRVVYSKDVELFETSTKFVMTLHDKWLDAAPWCKLFSREIIINFNLRFSKEFSLGEDLIFNFNYLEHTNGRILIINKCLYNYVKQSNYSLTKKYHKDMYKKYIRIYSFILSCLQKWKCDRSQIITFYNSCFYMYEFALRNTFNPNSTQKKKFRYNRTIMKSEEFKSALMNSDCYINPVYRFGYSHAMSWFVRLLDKVLIKPKQ